MNVHDLKTKKGRFTEWREVPLTLLYLIVKDILSYDHMGDEASFEILTLILVIALTCLPL